MKEIFKQKRIIYFYGMLMAVFVFVLKFLQSKFLVWDDLQEVYMGIIAVIFTLFGLWLAFQINSPKQHFVPIEKEEVQPIKRASTIQEIDITALKLSNRESDILGLIAINQSNADIAKTLFISISTVKSHIGNLFAKLDVKSRTQAINKAKRLRIID